MKKKILMKKERKKAWREKGKLCTISNGMDIAGVHLIGWDVFHSMKHGGPGIGQVANLSKVLLAGSYEDSC